MIKIDLLTVDEVAAILRVSRDSAYQIVRAGEIRSFRVGRLIRIDRADLYAFMKKQQQTAKVV